MTDKDIVHTFVTDLVPSEIAYFDSSSRRMRQSANWILREEMVDLEYAASS
jgi:hypothetical protein